MSHGESPNPFLHALKARHALVLKTIAAILLVAGAAAFLTRQYSASAVVALNPNARTRSGASPVELAWTALTDQEIAALIQKFQLNTELAQLRSHGQVFTYLRSNISFNEMASPGSDSSQVVVSYTGEGRSSVVNVANAVAQVLAEAEAPSQQPASITPATPATPAAAISDELKKSRANLELLSRSQHGSISQADVERHLKTDADLKAAQREIMLQLAALQQQSGHDVLAMSQVRTPPPPPPPNPARIALQQQIKQAQERLDALRQKYTDQYPDVEDARGALAALQAKLRQIPAEEPRPQPPHREIAPAEGELLTIAKQQDDLRAEEGEIERKIKANADETETLRQRLADQQTFAQDYALEQQHYNSLLQAQQSTPAQKSVKSGPVPLFIVVAGATAAAPLSIGLTPVFWVASLIAALLAASIVAFLAEQYSPSDAVDEERRSHSFTG